MQGAREYFGLFQTGQYGRLYIVNGSHARGITFHIYVLPENEIAKPNGPNNPPLNECVEVYGVISGQKGWDEVYGWKYEGKWQEDFYRLVEERKKKRSEITKQVAAKELQLAIEKSNREKALLERY